MNLRFFLSAALVLVQAVATPSAIAESAESKVRLCYMDHGAHPTNIPLIACIDVKEKEVPGIFRRYKIEGLGVEDVVWPNGGYRRLCDMKSGGSGCITITVEGFYEIYKNYHKKSLNPD